MFLQNWNNHFYKDQRKSKLIRYLLLLHLKGLKPENKCLRKISKKIKISQNKITCNIKTNPPLWSRAEKQSTDWRLGHRWRDLCGMTESLKFTRSCPLFRIRGWVWWWNELGLLFHDFHCKHPSLSAVYGLQDHSLRGVM